MADPLYRLGCPVWACPDWVGELYSTKDRRRWLGEYSRVFGSVEGNSVFYALPEVDLVKRWADESADGFRFVLKFPAAITHERQLVGVEQLTEAFVERLAVLRDAGRLGPTLMQLPPFFAGAQFPALDRYLRAWPRELPLAVEVRHHDYFDRGETERAFDRLLSELSVDRALFDSRPLFAAPASDQSERASQGRKPKSPHRLTTTAATPVVRLVGRNNVETIAPWLDEWAEVVAGWISEGKRPYFFTHAPDDRFAANMAERFHDSLRRRLPTLAPLPPWHGRGLPKQRRLFPTDA